MATVTDDPLVRVGRWALAKVWFGVVLSGGYALGRHFDWPQAFLTAAAVLGAVALALASSFLPVWTRQRPSGIPVADVGLRVMVWGGLTVSVVALLAGMPAVGMVAAALLLNTAARTFGDPFAPFLRRLRITPPVRYAAAAPWSANQGAARVTRPGSSRVAGSRAAASGVAGARTAGSRTAGRPTRTAGTQARTAGTQARTAGRPTRIAGSRAAAARAAAVAGTAESRAAVAGAVRSRVAVAGTAESRAAVAGAVRSRAATVGAAGSRAAAAGPR